MALQPSTFAGQNWVITPVALAINESKPGGISNQKWLIVLTGAIIVDLQGIQTNDWHRETLEILPDIDAPMRFAISKHAIPGLKQGVHPVFDLEQWAPFAALGSIFHKTSANSVDAGFAVDVWRPHPFRIGTDINGAPVKQLFSGIDVDIAVRNNRATLHRISYHFTLIGKIVFMFDPVVG